MLEGYLEIGTSVFVGLEAALTNTWGSSDFALWFQNIFTIFFSIVIVALPIWILYYIIIRHSNELQNEEFQKKFGSVYEGVLLDSKAVSKRTALIYVLYFLFRRLSLISISILLMDQPLFNIMVQMVISVLVISYLISFNVFQDSRFNKLEIFNEVCTILTLYAVLYFTDIIYDVEYRYNVGWIFILIVAVNVLVHGSLMLIDTCKTSCLKCKQTRHRLF